MEKDSFIIYTSFYKPISKLSDKQLGRLFRAIFNYHIDGAVTVEEDIEMAFAFFINQFEIDDSKYQRKVERNRESGRKGGMSRVNREKENCLMDCENGDDNKRTLENPSERLKDKRTKRTLENPSLNDNDNDNELSSTTTRTRVSADGDADEYTRFLDEFFKDQISVEAFCMNNHISTEDFRRIAEETVTEWRLTGQKHQSDNDARKHLLNQTRKKLYANETDKTDRLSERRGTDPGSKSRKGFKGTF